MSEACQKCGSLVQVNESECPSCGTPAGFPNVKVARSEEAELLDRSAKARQHVTAAGLGALLAELEALAASTEAVINCSPAFAHHLLCSDHPLYASYQEMVAAGVRRPAQLFNDRDRTTVESKLYGSGGGKITYAALSANGHGLTSYGPITLQLRRETIDHRASVLEENSYDFARRHAVQVLGPVPRGFMATWQCRSELAVAKLGVRLTSPMQASDLRELLLHSDGDRSHDEFLEVHIWGGFGRGALEHVAVSKPLDEDEEQLLADLAEEKARQYAVRWSSV